MVEGLGFEICVWASDLDRELYLGAQQPDLAQSMSERDFESQLHPQNRQFIVSIC